VNKLLIVESPGKIRKLTALLPDGWRVEASGGHVRDLPEGELGIALNDGQFSLHYRILKTKATFLHRLRKAIQAADEVYLASDPDREGEAIAWHLTACFAAELKGKRVQRVTFSAITPSALQAALAAPRPIDMALVEAQQTRRTVDRLVGYLLSPLACKALDAHVSAGRVQSVALRFVVEREREIRAFTPTPYWTFGMLLTAEGNPFHAALATVQQKPAGRFTTQAAVDKLAAGLQDAVFWVDQVATRDVSRRPPPPFTTSTLQQAASKALGWSPDLTMQVAQKLYEAGHITYMRTDSVTVAPEAQHDALVYITRTYGPTYAPGLPQVYVTKNASAQEAHEAIRPTHLEQAELPDGETKAATLYALIRNRFLASQMADARYHALKVNVLAGKAHGQPYPLTFEARGRSLTFDGWLKAYREALDEGEPAEEGTPLPPLVAQQLLSFTAWAVQAQTTKAPARYTEASLIQTLEARGIGRPSTFASMVKLLKDKDYAKLEHKRLVPTAQGEKLLDFLLAHFAALFDYAYTARLEESLDQVATHNVTRLAVLRAFWEEQLSGPYKKLAAQYIPPSTAPTKPPVFTAKPGRRAK